MDLAKTLWSGRGSNWRNGIKSLNVYTALWGHGFLLVGFCYFNKFLWHHRLFTQISAVEQV